MDRDPASPPQRAESGEKQSPSPGAAVERGAGMPEVDSERLVAAAADIVAGEGLGGPVPTRPAGRRQGEALAVAGGRLASIRRMSVVWQMAALFALLFLASLSVSWYVASQAYEQDAGDPAMAPGQPDPALDAAWRDEGGARAGEPGSAGAEPVAGPHVVPGDDAPILAVVIDDWGYGWQAARDFLAFERPLTVAVLPHLPYSRTHASEANDRGHQVILHLPMEPLGAQWDLGEGTVTTSKSESEISADVRRALASVPHVTGVNNHMGSKATADRRVMAEVLRVIAENGLFFLDSRTTSESVAGEAGQEVGARVLVNDRFIDTDDDAERIRERILLGAGLAKRRGYAVVIGHVRPETYRALVASLPELDREGVRLAYLSEVLERVYPGERPQLDPAERPVESVPAGAGPLDGSPAAGEGITGPRP